MNIQPLSKDYIPNAAALFVGNYQKLRRNVPELPDRLENPAQVAVLLEKMLEHSTILAALEGPRLLGYLGWWLVDGFRETQRKAGYAPEWAHGTVEENRPGIYRALYRAASAAWLAAGCHAHAITLLAHDESAIQTWFWNGFGLTVIDALRPAKSLYAEKKRPAIAAGYALRKAGVDDAPALAELEAEHVRHYAQPPLLMVPMAPYSREEYAAFLRDPANCAWLALQGKTPAGYLRFETRGHGASEIVFGEGSIANTGAFVRPAHRGSGLAPALLDAALADFAAQGFQRCSVDFESFNPEAVAFWTRYFTPVCFSAVRVPEREPRAYS